MACSAYEPSANFIIVSFEFEELSHQYKIAKYV